MILGIDPGLSGALALWEPDLEILHVWDMPVHVVKRKSHLDLYKLVDILRPHAGTISMAYIEDVNAMPRQGVTSTFRFGFAAGAAQAAVAGLGIAMTLVRPAQWKQKMGLTSEKDASLQMATRLLPAFRDQWARKKDDGRAEAALLCLYGERHA